MGNADVLACVRQFLVLDKRPGEELKGNHFWHFRPSTGGRDPKSYIIIDIEKGHHPGPMQEDFPHEIYRVDKKEDKM
ncbi:hypothetical protein N7494_005453 [Penicillium frequentans]|uniref:Uncharacterized protein n=1 Tax=Penicillium frequentans TaxID=3151616 RepID=A0AAD6GH16_9EURO|nr:hypothetical protein N7494_005453 [Penicillium glabrum]